MRNDYNPVIWNKVSNPSWNIFSFSPQQKRLNYKEFKLFTIFAMDKYLEKQKAEKKDKQNEVLLQNSKSHVV